jgi:hypothetical protein
MNKVHSTFFHGDEEKLDDEKESDSDEEEEEEEEVLSEDERSLGGNEASQHNVDCFLKFAKYNKDELSEFYFCLENGMDVDEAGDMVLQRRFNMLDKQGIEVSPKTKVWMVACFLCQLTWCYFSSLLD